MAMRNTVITGVGLVSPLGHNPTALFNGLMAGHNPISDIESFDSKQAPVGQAAEIRNFQPKAYLGDCNFRPLDRAGLFSVTAVDLALKNSGWTKAMRSQWDLGLVLGTVYCGVQTIFKFDRDALRLGPKYAKPMDFANTVINAAAGQTALWHNLRGANTTVATGASSGLEAWIQGTQSIATARENFLLAGGVEALCFETLFSYGRAGILAGTHGKPAKPQPFCEGSQGFILGEGAAFAVLEEEGFAKARGANILGEIRGFASRFDPGFGKDPKIATAALVDTMTSALSSAGVAPQQIQMIAASANGDPAMDCNELNALEKVFPDCLPPLMAIKGSLGESLGASGPLQAIALLECLKRKQCPQAHFNQPHLSSPGKRPYTDTDRNSKTELGLVNGFSYDGHYCSLVLAQPQPE